MNLLKDPWIPVRDGAAFRQIAYKELLCKEQPGLQVALPRDDLELACIEMLAALTQVIFIPEDRKELRARVKTPLGEEEYDRGVAKYMEWFDMDHPRWPFMQVAELDVDTPTPVQKLFPGLPAGNNHAFFNGTDEVNRACLSCAAIGLFNLCTHTPNLSGKHKGGLRGNAPVSTMIYGSKLRKMIWVNVLSRTSIDRILPGDRDMTPVWVDPIDPGKSIPAASIGLARGLFWAPVHARFVKTCSKARCDCCGCETDVWTNGFLLGSDLKFEIVGLWPHPYSPRQMNLQKENSKGQKKPEESIVSFRTTEPAWTQFSEFLFESARTDKKAGYAPAAVVSQFNELYSDSPVDLLVGGYRNKQAAILQRRHEMYSMPTGWNEQYRAHISEIVEIGLSAEKLLTDKVLYPVVKGNKEKGVSGVGSPVNSQASELFYHLTEPLIHRMLRESSLREYVAAKDVFIDDLTSICFDVFNRVTAPYVHKPELIGTVAIAREKLEGLLKKLKKEHTVPGGQS